MKILREPLLHFLLAGGALFAVYVGLNRDDDNTAQPPSRTVRISASEIDWLKQTWSRQWHRSPSDDELRGLVADHLREELLAREARELKLDENDTVVRRRLAQKMEFLVQDTVQVVEPDDDQLRRFYESQRERFLAPARLSFAHVYFNRERRGPQAERDANAALQRLSQSAEPVNTADLGDRFLAPLQFTDADEQAVASALGAPFARQVFEFEAGRWHGPVASGYGLHLVRVESRQAAQPREWAVVKGEVLALWRQQQAQQEREQFVAMLLKKYDVVADDSVKWLIEPLTAHAVQAR